MALTSPGITLATEALFGNVKPALDLIEKLGPTDFSAEAPGIDVKPGATLKFPWSTVSAAQAYNASSNNYLTGGDTDWGSLTATHYLQGFDLTGTNIDEGVNASRIKQLFTKRAGTGVSMAAIAAIKTALDGTTASTGVKIPAVASADIEDYDGLASCKDWFDAANAVLCVNGTELAHMKAVFHAAHLSATRASMAEELGFRDVVCIPGMTARAVIVPYSTIGFIARVPTIIADFKEFGTETDPDSGLSIGIVIANEQSTNRLVANADLWFGVVTKSANAAASEAGIIKVGTQA